MVSTTSAGTAWPLILSQFGSVKKCPVDILNVRYGAMPVGYFDLVNHSKNQYHETHEKHEKNVISQKTGMNAVCFNKMYSTHGVIEGYEKTNSAMVNVPVFVIFVPFVVKKI